MSAISKKIKSIEDKIDSVNTCEQLDVLKKEIDNQMQKLQASLSASLNKLQPLIVAIPSPSANLNDLKESVDGIISWINTQVTTIQEAVVSIQKDVLEVTQAVTSLTNKTIQKATSLGCDISQYNQEE